MADLPLFNSLTAQQWLLAYGGALLALLALDALFLSLFMAPAYKTMLGDAMLAQPRLVPAALFYLLFPLGVVALAIAPAQSLGHAAVLGALLGLVAYGTYDLTNYSILHKWTLSLTLIDIVWGALLSASAASAGYWLARRFG